MSNPLLDLSYGPMDELVGPNRSIVPFLACGDLNSYDSDMTYPIQTERYETLTPVQMPIDPPYKTAVELKRANKLNGTTNIGK